MTNLYFCSHFGLGDNISNSSAVRFLLQYYDTIYFGVYKRNESNVKLLFIDKPQVIVYSIDNNNVIQNFDILKNIYNNTLDDILCSGRADMMLQNKKFNRIKNVELLKYKPDNKNYTNKYGHINYFYSDIGLDLSIYYEYFHIPLTEISKQYYETIKKYKIIFLHSTFSGGELNIDSNLYNKYIDNNEYIIIHADKNIYNPDTHTEKYTLANQYVYLPVPHYIDIILNANEIYISDSAFACIVIPLQTLNKLKADKIEIFDRPDWY